MKKITLGMVGILIIATIIFVIQPAPIDPETYDPPETPQTYGTLVKY